MSSATPEVRIIRSTRRRRTAAARDVGDAIEVRVPAGLGAAEEAHIVARLVRRVSNRRNVSEIDLPARATALATRFGLAAPTSAKWVDNQTTRWGSCSPATGAIRLSRALSAFPGWVLDYVIVHELAHLEVHGHGPAFWQIVSRYPLTERARGFLIAKGLEQAGVDSARDSGADNDVTRLTSVSDTSFPETLYCETDREV